MLISRHSALLTSTILLMVSQLSCGIFASRPSSPTEIVPERTDAALLVGLSGQAYIKRDGWKDFQPVGFGAFVYPTDLLKTDDQILLLCADLQTIKALTGLNRNSCPLPQNNQALKYDNMWFSSGSRSIPPDDIPFILYPRATTIIEGRPILRWHKTKAASYTVEIWQGSEVIWRRTDIPDDSIVYPSNASALEAGQEYLVVITDSNGGISSDDPNKGLGFQVISEEQRVEIESQQQAILNLDELDPAAQKLVLALYLATIQTNRRGLWNETSTLLADVTMKQPDAPAVYLRLGDAFGNMKLWLEARSAYEIALSLAQQMDDLESQADALAALWHITSNQPQFDSAIELYEKLGALQKADTLKKELSP